MTWLRGGLHKEVTALPIQLPAISRWQTFLRNKKTNLLSWSCLGNFLNSEACTLSYPPPRLPAQHRATKASVCFCQTERRYLANPPLFKSVELLPWKRSKEKTSLIPCPGALRWWLLFQVLPCNDRPCPIDCRWDHWSPWSPCTGTPETLNHERTLSKNHAAQADLAKEAQGKGWKGKVGLAVKAGQFFCWKY